MTSFVSLGPWAGTHSYVCRLKTAEEQLWPAKPALAVAFFPEAKSPACLENIVILVYLSKADTWHGEPPVS